MHVGPLHVALVALLCASVLAHDHGNFADRASIHDQEHLKQHLENKMNVEQQLSEEQERFHYFQMHDLNKDGMIDGIEIAKALNHEHPVDGSAPRPAMEEQTMEKLVDVVLQDMDTNGDGFVDYGEYMKKQS
uniref:EF-hand domain-containing protein n=1 Tax=Steinernema glaseri TaxID=37863 RepID=A0A1I7ZCV9_9BILA